MSTPKNYRIYSFDARFHDVQWDMIEAASDEEAIAKAQASVFGTKYEVWDGRRLVAQIDGERQTG